MLEVKKFHGLVFVVSNRDMRCRAAEKYEWEQVDFTYWRVHTVDDDVGLGDGAILEHGGDTLVEVPRELG
jgi:hypothetical protein